MRSAAERLQDHQARYNDISAQCGNTLSPYDYIVHVINTGGREIMDSNADYTETDRSFWLFALALQMLDSTTWKRLDSSDLFDAVLDWCDKHMEETRPPTALEQLVKNLHASYLTVTRRCCDSVFGFMPSQSQSHAVGKDE